jgi:hypothetical protein
MPTEPGDVSRTAPRAQSKNGFSTLGKTNGWVFDEAQLIDSVRKCNQSARATPPPEQSFRVTPPQQNDQSLRPTGLPKSIAGERSRSLNRSALRRLLRELGMKPLR